MIRTVRPAKGPGPYSRKFSVPAVSTTVAFVMVVPMSMPINNSAIAATSDSVLEIREWIGQGSLTVLRRRNPASSAPTCHVRSNLARLVLEQSAPARGGGDARTPQPREARSH